MQGRSTEDRSGSGDGSRGNAQRRSPRGARRRRARGRGRRGLLLLLLVAGLGVGGAYWAHRAGVLDQRALEQFPLPTLRSPEGPEVRLYFADERWTRLIPETRQIPVSGGSVAAMKAVVAALADGSRERLAPVLPEATELRGAYLGNDGLAVLDFAPDLAEYSPGGVSGELLSVFAVVNSVVDNVPGVKRVLILIGGQERETLAGHVKISEPLEADHHWLEAASTE